jgi:hypothetical protein
MHHLLLHLRDPISDREESAGQKQRDSYEHKTADLNIDRAAHLGH